MSENRFLTLGAGVLEDSQMEGILPGYKNIEKQIHEIRQYATYYRCNIKEKSKQGGLSSNNTKTTNNVFSVLGSRGSGKSSVLETLKHNIEYNQDGNLNEKDIVLPIILPVIFSEKTGSKSDMIGWLLGVLENHINLLDQVAVAQFKAEDRESNFMDCRKALKNSEVYKKYKEALKQYRYTKEDYADILKENFSGLNEYVDKTQKILDPENKLRNCFFELIDEMIQLKVKEGKKDKAQEEEDPLVFIFLDDIDLSKSYCQELLKLVIRYLSHPHIVVFISGDYQIFENEQFMSYMHDGGLMELIVNPRANNQIGKRLLRENELLAKDTLKKVMPPAYRYRLRTLSSKEKLEFYYNNEKQTTNKGDNRLTLEDLLKAKFKQVGKKKIESLKVINAYGMILDDMPRGIMNVYYALNSIDANTVLPLQSTYGDEKEASLKEKAYSAEFRILLDTIIRSSTILSQYEDEIKACIQIDDKFNQTFINHERLKKQIESSNKKYNDESKAVNSGDEDIDNAHQIHSEIVVFILAHFIESIVKLVNPNRKIHGAEQIWELVDQTSLVKDRFRLYPHIEETHIVLDLYEAMLNNDALNIMPTMNEVYLKDFSLKFYFEHLEGIDEFTKENISENITNIMIQDSDWVNEKFKVIYYHRDPVCMVFNKAIYTIKNKLVGKYKQVFTDRIKGKLKKEFYQDIKKDEEIYNKTITENVLDHIKEVMQRNKEKYREKLIQQLKKDDIELSDEDIIKKIDEESKEYFANIRLEELSKVGKGKGKGKDKGKGKGKGKGIDIDIINRAVIIEAVHQLDKLEVEYYAYFEEWHQSLDVSDGVYQKWYTQEKSQDSWSPLTLILESN